jgi:hypothetical protein
MPTKPVYKLKYSETPRDAVQKVPNLKYTDALHERAAAVLLLGLCVEHLALSTQSVGFGYKAVDLLSALQY